jgi:hypothetical protein
MRQREGEGEREREGERGRETRGRMGVCGGRESEGQGFSRRKQSQAALSIAVVAAAAESVIHLSVRRVAASYIYVYIKAPTHPQGASHLPTKAGHHQPLWVSWKSPTKTFSSQVKETCAVLKPRAGTCHPPLPFRPLQSLGNCVQRERDRGREERG